jgi:ribosomal protein S18 acetylase RimI-like enzyme
MVVALKAMSASESAQFIVASREAYLAQRVTAGENPEAAARAVAEMSREVFPDDKPAPGHLLFALEEDGKRVGTLWIGPGEAERPGEWWIWDIVIDESCRGRGLGRSAMLAAEREASAKGATGLGLTVFGHNPAARHLYESLGYGVVSMRMSKAL